MNLLIADDVAMGLAILISLIALLVLWVIVSVLYEIFAPGLEIAKRRRVLGITTSPKKGWGDE